MRKPQKVNVPFKLDKDVLQVLIKRAEYLDHSKSSYIRYLIERDIKDNPHVEKPETNGDKLAKFLNVKFRFIK